MSFIDSYNPHLLDGVQHVHFIGCGGSGTYPLIQILHSRGPVSYTHLDVYKRQVFA